MPKTKYTYLSIWESDADSHEDAKRIGKENGAVGMWRQGLCAHGCHVLNNLNYIREYVQELVFPEKKPTPDIKDLPCSKSVQ